MMVSGVVQDENCLKYRIVGLFSLPLSFPHTHNSWFTFNEWPSLKRTFAFNFFVSVFNCQRIAVFFPVQTIFGVISFVLVFSQYYAPHNIFGNSMSLTHFYDFNSCISIKKKDYRIWQIQGNICAKCKMKYARIHIHTHQAKSIIYLLCRRRKEEEEAKKFKCKNNPFAKLVESRSMCVYRCDRTWITH